MTATLSKSQADLPRLVEIASQGEDVVITVGGKPKAPLTRAETVVRPRQLSQEEKSVWLAELRARYSTGKPALNVEQIRDETRARRAAKQRLELKKNVMQDYDVVNFRFNK